MNDATIRDRRQPLELSLKIDAVSHEGLGEAQHNERPYLVRNALPGETVQARLLRKRKGKRYCDALEVLEDRAAARTESQCDAFPRCGGCALHHVSYPEQLAMKELWLKTELARQEISPDSWIAPVSRGQYAYRRKARLGVKKLGDQILVGFRESFSNRVARLASCPILTKELSALLDPLKHLVAGLSIPDRIPQIEVAQGDVWEGYVQTVLILRHLEELSERDQALLLEFAQTHHIVWLTQAAGYDSLKPLEGTGPELCYRLPELDLTMTFEAQQFTQVNHDINNVLISTVLEGLGDVGETTILDLFCGIGNFSLALAKAGARVLGYELDPTAIERAKYNADINGLRAETSFAVANLFTESVEIEDAQTIVLDPPRSGAGPMLLNWLSGQITSIAYISCNPVTFAADAATLKENGFALSQVGIFDMFPNTAHVETVGIFNRG